MALIERTHDGSMRAVFLTRRYVFKFPGRWGVRGWRWWWRGLLLGLLSNMQEREFAREGWSVSLSIPGGLLVVMPRARPLSDAEWELLDYRRFVTRGDGWIEANFDSYAGDWKQGDIGQPLSPLVHGGGDPASGLIPTEYKRDSFGVIDGRVVAVDYG
jgi:hypothetical protein